jgi:hypothetical protein
LIKRSEGRETALKIYKDRLGIEGNVVTIKGKIRKILTVQLQNGWPHVWYEVSDKEWVKDREIKIIAIGTGWEIPDEIAYWNYVGTVQDINGYVWHYYSDDVSLTSNFFGGIF